MRKRVLHSLSILPTLTGGLSMISGFEEGQVRFPGVGLASNSVDYSTDMELMNSELP